MKIFYYLKHIFLAMMPHRLFFLYAKYLNNALLDKQELVEQRVSYYTKDLKKFKLDQSAVAISNYKRKGYTSYYFDLKEFLHYFPKEFCIHYYFGDETHIEPVATLFKARPIEGENANSVLFKLDKRRHFRFVKDKLKFQEKKDMAIFRGAVTQPHRILFMNKMFSHPFIDAGQSNRSSEKTEWQKPFMSINAQLQYKFLICLEGNDVASNLKWAMSSNSVVVTPKMKFETWFMEGTLKAGIHYIEVKDDWSDFDEKIAYYLEHPEQAEQIIKNAQAYVTPFQDKKLEQLICIKTLERYFELSAQLDKNTRHEV